MKTSMRNKAQVYSVGNYLMTGKVLGKGHFARVEEATHRVIGKKVAIKIIDLTCIKEEYARRNLHREPTVMSRLRHPCIAALYETMMHGPRLYVVMEAAGGGDLCALVLGARGVSGGARGLPEARARGLAAQLVSAVRHMHARGVVHRDLKMENIMLDSSKTFIKIVDFGLSNVWSAVGGLHTPCGSLEYAAPELFRDTRRYGPELDLWSVGVIVYGMVTGTLPFVGGAEKGGVEGEGRSRPLLRAAIARGFSRKHRTALAAQSTECKTFIQQLLEPNVESRMKIEDAARHSWFKKPGTKMRTHPLGDVAAKTNREIYKQISELCGVSVVDIVSQIRSEPYGSIAGVYNIKVHLSQLGNLPMTDPLWTSGHETRPPTPPEYRPHRPTTPMERSNSHETKICQNDTKLSSYDARASSRDTKVNSPETRMSLHDTKVTSYGTKVSSRDTKIISNDTKGDKPTPPPNMMRLMKSYKSFENGDCMQKIEERTMERKVSIVRMDKERVEGKSPQAYGRVIQPMRSKPVYKVCDNGDCADSRLPSIAEHRKLDRWTHRPGQDRIAPHTCPGMGDRREMFYRKAADVTGWRQSMSMSTSTRLLLQNNATNIKRASLGNIVSPHSSTNSHCKSERAMPVGWYSTRSVSKEAPPTPLRLRRTAPIK